MDFSIRKVERLALAAVSIGFALWSAAFIFKSSFVAADGNRYFCLFDDAMISMRYAWNFSHGSGLVWNPGEAPVQGYTNLLMTLWMSLATLFFDKSGAVLFVQAAGAVFMLVIAFTSMRIAGLLARDQSPPRQALIRVLAFVCALSYYPLTYWTLMGMETGLLALLVTSGVLLALKYNLNPRPLTLFGAALLLGLAYLTRNDSLIFAALIASYIAWVNPELRARGRGASHFLAAVGVYLVFVLGQSLFQYFYYGEWLPNTYILKLTGMPLLNRLGNGLSFTRPFLAEILFILALSGLDLIFDFNRRKLLLFSIVSASIAYQVIVGGDPWDYWRMPSPAMPLLAVLFVMAVNGLVQAAAGTQSFEAYFHRNPLIPGRHIPGTLVSALTVIGLLSANARFLPEITLERPAYQTIMNQNSVNTALAINALTTPDASVGVFAAGAVPYFTDRRAIDFLGKSDRYIAGLPADISGSVAFDGTMSVPGHNKYDLNYSIVGLQPTYVADFQWGSQNVSAWGRAHYIKVEYHGVVLNLLAHSPEVLWDNLNSP